MANINLNIDHFGVANGKMLVVKNLCIGVGCILLSVGLYADILGTDWMPV